MRGVLMTRRFGFVWAAVAVSWLGAVMPTPAFARETPAGESGTAETEKKQAGGEEQKPGPATVEVDPGNGVTFSSGDGNYSLNIGFFGQFRAQYLDRDEFR